MIHETERITVREAINLLEHCGIRPPMRIRGSASYWLCEEVEQGRLVFHDHTGLRIEPVDYLGVFGLYKETTSRAQLNAWLERIGHLRRVPETGDLPAEPVKLCEFDEESRPVFSVPLCPAGVPAELLALAADTPVVGIETSGAYYATASKLADHIRGLIPASATCQAAAAPTTAPSASAPAVAIPEPVAATVEARRTERLPTVQQAIAPYVAKLMREHPYYTAEELHRQMKRDAGRDDSPFSRLAQGGGLFCVDAGKTCGIATVRTALTTYRKTIRQPRSSTVEVPSNP